LSDLHVTEQKSSSTCKGEVNGFSPSVYTCLSFVGRMNSSQDDLDDETSSLYSPSAGKSHSLDDDSQDTLDF